MCCAYDLSSDTFAGVLWASDPATQRLVLRGLATPTLRADALLCLANADPKQVWHDCETRLALLGLLRNGSREARGLLFSLLTAYPDAIPFTWRHEATRNAVLTAYSKKRSPGFLSIFKCWTSYDQDLALSTLRDPTFRQVIVLAACVPGDKDQALEIMFQWHNQFPHLVETRMRDLLAREGVIEQPKLRCRDVNGRPPSTAAAKKMTNRKREDDGSSTSNRTTSHSERDDSQDDDSHNASDDSHPATKKACKFSPQVQCMLDGLQGMDKNMILELANGCGAGRNVRRGVPFLKAYSAALAMPKAAFVQALRAADGDLDECWTGVLEPEEIRAICQ